MFGAVITIANTTANLIGAAAKASIGASLLIGVVTSTVDDPAWHAPRIEITVKRKVISGIKVKNPFKK